jgi:hypothetical protein
MEQKLKELIQLSIVDGSISNEKKDYIYSKAAESGIDKIECDIVIENLIYTIKNQHKNISDASKTTGTWFILIGIIDFFTFLWYKNVVGNTSDGGFGALFFISSIIFLLVGFHYKGYKKVYTIIYIIIASFLIMGFFLKIFDIESGGMIMVVFCTTLSLLLYLFKRTIFGERFSQIISIPFLDSKLFELKKIFTRDS